MFFKRQIHPEVKTMIQDVNLDSQTFRKYAAKIGALPQPITSVDLDHVFSGEDEDTAMTILVLLGFHDYNESGLHALDADENDILTRAKNYNDIIDVLANLI